MSTPIFLVSVVLSLVILWAVRTHMPSSLRLVLSILIVVILLVALLSVFGFLGPLWQPSGHVR
jgi:Ca2+/Na+ antiporter